MRNDLRQHERSKNTSATNVPKTASTDEKSLLEKLLGPLGAKASMPSTRNKKRKDERIMVNENDVLVEAVDHVVDPKTRPRGGKRE